MHFKKSLRFFAAALVICMIITMIPSGSFCSYAADKDIKASDTGSTAQNEQYTEETEEEDITSRIIVSVNNYLQLTSHEGIQNAPVLNSPLTPVKRMIIDMNEDDIYMLACQTFVEAGAEPYDAQVGVASVIINRILSDQFPDNVTDVLYESGQFPPAYNGLLDAAMENGSGYEVMDAVNDALYGAKPVGDYLYFNMAAGVNLDDCKSFMKIGDTVFFSPKYWDDEEYWAEVYAEDSDEDSDDEYDEDSEDEYDEEYDY